LGDYVAVKSQGVNFDVEAQGSSTNLVPGQFQKLMLMGGTHNTFVLGGDTQIVRFLFQDDNSPATNSVKLRAANADPSAVSPQGVWVFPQGMTASGNPTMNVALGSASNSLVLIWDL
jgi:hypothetical protein